MAHHKKRKPPLSSELPAISITAPTLIEAFTGTDQTALPKKSVGESSHHWFARLPLPDGTFWRGGCAGHERFVRQMIAGASGIDLALLCIAADDGSCPKHASTPQSFSCSALQLRYRLTKCDLVDEEWIELVSEEVREGQGRNVPLADAPLVPVSARTGQGAR